MLDGTESSLSSLLDLLSPYKALVNTCTVEFITGDLFSTTLSQEVQDCLLAMSDEQLARLPSRLMVPGDEKGQGEVDRVVDMLRGASLEKLGIVRELLGEEEVSDTTLLDHFDKIMPPKKTHEVCRMSKFVMELVKKCKTNGLLDLGSGKAYLSHSLVALYKVPVLAIDSSASNSRGAELRENNLTARWAGLKGRAEERRVTGRASNRRERYKQARGVREKMTGKVGARVEKSVNGSDAFSDFKESSKVESEHIQNYSSEKESDILEKYVGILESGQESTRVSGDHVTRMDEISDDKVRMGTEDHLDRPKKRSHDQVEEPEKKSDDKADIPEKGSDGQSSGLDLLVNLTQFVACGSDCGQLVSLHLGSEAAHRFGMMGLHTCGDLSPTSLRLFLSSPSCSFLCNVGCCYHHVTEKFYSHPDITQDTLEGAEPGFPLSRALLARRAWLGRPARMLAAQPLDRLANNPSLPTRALLWRAVLQVFIEKHAPDLTFKQRQVGKIAGKSHTFVDYCRRAFSKFGVKLVLSDEEVQQTYTELEQEFGRKLSAFHQFRALFAPLVESIILVDRLAYLQEQAGVADAYIIKMFDSHVSPRAYAIVASK